MKKKTFLVSAMLLLVCLVGCSGDNRDSKNKDNDGTGLCFHYKETEIALNTDAAPILKQLGEPKNYTEEPSCAFDGLDKTYDFGSFYLQTYPNENKDYIFSLWFADDSVTTDEGIHIGTAQADVEKAYGADGYNGTNAYMKTVGDTKLTIMVKEGEVTSILYEADIF